MGYNIKDNEDFVIWKNVLYFPNVQCYLNLNDIIEHSMTCKFMRIKLTKTIFKKLNLRNFIYNNDYKSFVIREVFDSDSDTGQVGSDVYFNPYHSIAEEFQTDINRFKTDLKHQNHHPVRTLVMNYIVDYFYSYTIPSIFNRITNLTLTRSALSLDLFQYLLNNLELTSLTFKECSFFTDKTQNSLSIPDTLNDLCFGDCWLNFIQNKHPIVGYRRNFQLPKIHLLPEPRYISNLKLLIFYNYAANGLVSLKKFLSQNPQLKSITYFSPIASGSDLDFIQSEPRVNCFILNDYWIAQDYNLQLLRLENLTTLHCDYNHCYYKLDEITSYCLNLTNLIIKNAILRHFQPNFSKISKAKKLMKLTFNCYRCTYNSEIIDFPIFNTLLEVIEFNNIFPINLNWKNLNLLPKLFKVKFNGILNTKTKQRIKSEVIPELYDKSWKFIYYPETAVYHKYLK